MFMGRRRSSVFSSSSGVNSPEVAMRIRDNIGDDFFERFCGLPSRLKDYRIRADKEAEKEQNTPYKFPGSTINAPGYGRRDSRAGTEEELEELYVEVLYTIKHKIGQTDPFQNLAYNKELVDYAQHAFGIDNARHNRLFSKANEEKPPKVVLNVTVVEGRDLEAKDANGFSDPYCMLGLIGHKSRKQVEVLQSTPSLETYPEEAKERSKKSSLYKHNRTKSRRDCNTDILEQLPAKFIRTTTVKKATLNPQWNETFQLPVDDAGDDVLHLDIFDHDEEYEVLDAVKNVKNVQGIKGLNRYFKQIAQSARKSAADNVDDFLGCVDLRVLDIPSIGIDKVFDLYSRTASRSKVQGTIRLRLGLTTREDKNQSNNLSDFIQHKDLMTIFMKSEIKQCKTSLEWSGDLGELAETILHQHAIQGNLTDLQLSACSWIALADIHVATARLDYLVLFQALKHLDSLWVANGLGPDAEELTAEAVGNFKDYALSCVEKQTSYFPMARPIAQRQLESLLKCLRLLYDCKFFKRFFPLDDNMNGTLIDAVKNSAANYYTKIKQKFHSDSDEKDNYTEMDAFSTTVMAVSYDLRKYFKLAEKTYVHFKIKYFAITVSELDHLINDDFAGIQALKQSADHSDILQNRDPYVILKEDFFTAPGKEEPNAEIFVLYLALNDFKSQLKHLNDEDRQIQKWAQFHIPFVPFLLQWLSYAKVAAKRKMKSWVENDKVPRGESLIRYSTSVIEANNCITLITTFVRDLKWPDPEENCIIMCKLMSDAAEEVAYFSEITYRAFKDSGWIEHELLEVNDDLCIAVNNLETMRCHFVDLPHQLGCYEMTKPFRESGNPVLMKFAADCDNVVIQAVTNGQKMLTERITKALEKLLKKMSPEINRQLSKLVGGSTVSVENVIRPTQEFMDSVLGNLYSIMLKANFLRFLEVLWLNVLDQIMAITFSNRSKDPMCFVNLYQSLGIFMDYFHAGDRGLPRDVIESERYQSVKRKVFYHQLSTPELIDSFLVEAVNFQSTLTKTPYGTLTVRSHYDKKAGKVMLEGLSDPFVIIRFLPVRIFGTGPTAKTAVVKKSLDPDFDERFEFSIPVDKCNKECSTVHLALMDHDVMFQDELAGEAFLQLCRLPGLKGEQTKNFSGLRETTIPLLHPQLMTSGILADIIEVLRCRENQKDGVDFLTVLSVT